MPRVSVKKKVVDPLTGSITYKKSFITLNKNDPANSLEFHRLADLLEINRYDRLNPHNSTKIAILYNFGARKSGSNDVTKIVSELNKEIKHYGFSNIKGKELLTKLYRAVRLRESQMTDDPVTKTSTDEDRAKEAARAEQLRKSGVRQQKVKAKGDKSAKKDFERASEKTKQAAEKKDRYNSEAKRVKTRRVQVQYTFDPSE